MINFDALPQGKPVGSLLDTGFYKATITKAEMKARPKGGSDYLALTYDCINAAGKKGKIWDNFFDIDKELPRYKIARLITALAIPLTGNFELKDLCKVVTNKQLVVDVGVDEKAERPRNQVEVFKNEIYYPISEWAALAGGAVAAAAINSGDVPFTVGEDTPATVNARDSIDAVTDTTGASDY